MSTRVDIANGALAHIGETTINSFQDKTKAAKLIRDRYEQVRREVLRRHPWKSVFARRRLSPTTGKPAFGQRYQYAYPADALRIWYVVVMGSSRGEIPGVPSSSKSPEIVCEDRTWGQVGKHLVSDYADIGVAYVRDEPNTNLYDDLLIEVISLKLAFAICYPLTQDRDLKKDIFGYFTEAMSKARSVDAQQEAPKGMKADAWAALSRRPGPGAPLPGLI
jgi:hypothetical protein